MFTYNILIYQFEPEPLILRGFPALLIHLSVENGIMSSISQLMSYCKHYFFIPNQTALRILTWKAVSLYGKRFLRGKFIITAPERSYRISGCFLL